MLRFLAVLFALVPAMFAAGINKGDTVRLTKGENLMLNGKNLSRAVKGSEFIVLGRESSQKVTQVAFMKDDGSWIAASLPDDALEVSAPSPWQDLLRGVESFRDQRYDERLLARAAAAPASTDEKAPKDPSPALAAALAPRLKAVLNALTVAQSRTPAAIQALGNALGTLRDVAVQLDTAGHPALAAALDEGIEKLAKTGGATLPAGKMDRATVSARGQAAERAAVLARQALAARKLIAAQRQIEQGLGAAAAHPLLKIWQPKVTGDLAEAQSLHDTAQKMRRFDKGLVHALSALDDGLKLCADHPALRELRQDMNTQFEERTSPRVTPAFLSAAKVKTSREVLEEGRQLYTSRCTECHDLEMIDSRGRSGWERIVGGMARRANLSGTEQGRIVEYLGAAVNAVETLNGQ